MIECNLDTAIPLGLIANEAISNSLKHAFPEGRAGRILVRLRRVADAVSPRGFTDREAELLISDNGIGRRRNGDLPPDGIGMTLIYALADQIDADVTVKNETGHTLRIRFASRGNRR